MQKLSEYHYHLPPQRIAQHPVDPRDHSRLMVVARAGGAVSHHRFKELPLLLQPGDLLVTNNTRVVPARMLGRKASGGKIEALALNMNESRRGDDPHTLLLKCLIKASKSPRPGTTLFFDKGIEARIVEGGDGHYTLAFDHQGDSPACSNELDRYRCHLTSTATPARPTPPIVTLPPPSRPLTTVLARPPPPRYLSPHSCSPAWRKPALRPSP